MAENLGAIRYEVEVETASMLKAEAVVNKSIAKNIDSFNKADDAVRKYVSTQKDLGRTVNSMGQVIDKNGQIVAAATNRYRSLATDATKGFAVLNTEVNKSTKGIRKALGSNLGQAGIQVQQFVGQLQGGQSAMVALAQQSADLGIVLGAPLIGVFVSLAAVLAGTLAPAIFGSVSNIEKLQKAIENTKVIMTLGKNGIIEYTDEMKRLETASENLAKIKIALAITENTKALKDSRKEFTAMRADLFGFQEDSHEAAKRLTGMTDKTDDVLRLASSLQIFSNAVTDESKLKALESAEKILLNMRNDKGEFPTKDLTEFAQKFFDLSDATRQAISNNQALKSSNEGLNTSASNTGESFNQLRIGLKEQTIALQDGERAAFKYSLLMSGKYSAAQIKEALIIYDTNAALVEQKRAREENAKALEAEIDAYIKIGEEALKAEEKKEAAAQRERDRLAERGTTVGLTEVQSIEMKYENDLSALVAAREQQLITNQEYDAREVELNRQKQEAIRGTQAETNQFMQDAFANLDTQIAGTMAQVIIGAKDGKEAMRGLANTMLTQVIGAAVQYGIELVKNRILGQALATSEQANIAATTATGIASQQAATASTVAAAATTATAAAPAAALTSTFSFGSAAVIGLGALAATFAAAKLMGGRQYGGAVSSGMYRVNETGVPEVYSHGGKDYLMNTKNANIKNLDQGGGGGWSVNVENYGPDKVYTTIDEVNRAVNVGIAREAGRAAKGQGPMLKGLQSGTNLKRNARS